MSRAASARRLRQLLDRCPTRHARRHLPVAAAISTEPLVDGNRVTLLEDGPAIEAAIREIVAGAKKHVNVETYILADDEVGRRFADLLVRKCVEHVPVTLMYDSFASR